MLCKYCPLKRTCSQICSYLEPHLPSMEQGRVDYEDLLRIYQGRLMTQALLDRLIETEATRHGESLKGPAYWRTQRAIPFEKDAP